MSEVLVLSDLVSRYIQDLKEERGFYTGYIDGKDAFETFFIHLRASGYWFVTKHCSQTAGDHAKKGAVFFQNVRKGSDLQIAFFGALYEHVKNVHYECSQGKKRQHGGKTKKLLFPGKKRRVRCRSSKKIGCSASMTVWHISVFPEYRIDKYNNHGSEEQTKLAKQLKAHIAAGNEAGASSSQPTRYDRYVIRLSTANVHNHPTLSGAMTQTLHPELIAEIGSLVKKNIFTIREIEVNLVEFVQRKVQESIWPPSERQNSCFYPNHSVIYNHMHKALFELKEKKLDQDELDHYIATRIPSNDKIYFRRCVEGSTARNETQLLVCHQASWQKHLLELYGGDICVLETYKKTVYNLFLFFVVVKTNVGYSVAGSFIIHNMSSALVEDALRIFISWNPDWDPLYFMTDVSNTEINAIAKVFPDTSLYLSAHYRDQAWDNWLNLQDNELPADTQATFKRHWKEIACSKTISEFEENVMIMKNSDEYEQYPKVQRFMEVDWLPEAHHWADAFLSEDFLTKLYFMNGVEAQSQQLNHEFLKENSDKSLSELVDLVVTDYLPFVMNNYLSAQLSTEHGSPGADFPEFLNGRPIHFVKHVMQRYSAALEEFSARNITSVGEDKFIVAVGEARNTHYLVDFDMPSCTCTDFSKWYYPCTHLCAVFLNVPNKSFKDLPISYLTSPYLTLDQKFLDFVDSPDAVPMYDNTVTIFEIDQSDGTDCLDPKIIDMTSEIIEVKPVDEVTQVRKLLKEMYNQTFLMEDNDQYLAKAKSKLLDAKLLLAEGIPLSTMEPPPLSRIVKKTENHTKRFNGPTGGSSRVTKKFIVIDVEMATQTKNHTNQCKGLSEGSTQLTKKIRIPNVEKVSQTIMAEKNSTSQCKMPTEESKRVSKKLRISNLEIPKQTVMTDKNHTSQCKVPTKGSIPLSKKVRIPSKEMTTVVESRKRPWEGSSRMTKKLRIPSVQLAAVPRNDLQSPSEVPKVTPSTRTGTTEKTSNKSLHMPSEMPPLLVRKGEVPDKLWVALARKQS